MHQDNPLRRRSEVVFLDEMNARSLVNLLPDAMSHLLKIAWNDPPKKALLGLGEKALRNEMIRHDRGPTAMDNRLRFQFWLEFDRCQLEEDRPRLIMQNVLGTLIPKEVFYSHYIVDIYKFAWLMCPPLHYVAALEETLTYALEQLRESITAPIKRENGEINLTYADYVMRTHSKLHAHLQAVTKDSRRVPKVEAVKAAEAPQKQLSIQERLEQKRALAAQLKGQTAKEAPPPTEEVAGE